jgi:hypothetical protein
MMSREHFEPSDEYRERVAKYERNLVRHKRAINFLLTAAVLSTVYNALISWAHLALTGGSEWTGYTQLIPTAGSAAVVYVALRLSKTAG